MNTSANDRTDGYFVTMDDLHGTSMMPAFVVVLLKKHGDVN